MTDDSVQHIIYFLSGSTVLGIIAHAVATFPTPKNAYGQWVLGVIKYAVGQRVSAVNAFNGLQTEVVGVTQAQKEDLAKGNTMEVVKESVNAVLKPKNGNGTQH